MVWQLAEPEYKAKRISNWRVGGRALRAWRLCARRGFAAITDPRLHPTAHERHGHEQQSAIALKLLFGYLNCRPSNIVVKYSTEGGGDSLLGTKGGQLLKRSLFLNCDRTFKKESSMTKNKITKPIY